MSWVIVNKATGRAVLEVWQASVAAKVNRAAYDVFAALEWLQRINLEPTRKEFAQ